MFTSAEKSPETHEFVTAAKPAPVIPPDSVRDEEQTAQLANWLVRALEKFYDATLYLAMLYCKT